MDFGGGAKGTGVAANGFAAGAGAFIEGILSPPNEDGAVDAELPPTPNWGMGEVVIGGGDVALFIGGALPAVPSALLVVAAPIGAAGAGAGAAGLKSNGFSPDNGGKDDNASGLNTVATGAGGGLAPVGVFHSSCSR